MNCKTKRVMKNRSGTSSLLSLGISALLMMTGFAWAATPALVPVGDTGNANDPATGFGAVNYGFQIGSNEVTRAEYADFLNAVASVDTHALYNPNMGIVRTGSSGSYSYAATDGTRSVAWVSWYDALRFANWLHNGQPRGAQGAASTEFGAYTFSGESSVSNRNAEAKVFLPSENEWYKAAYYQGGGNAFYWAFPTRSDTPPLALLPNSSDNAANYDRVANAVTPAGAYATSQGYYGTHDQAGNLWEWNEALIDGDRGLRGGSYDDYPLLLHASYRDSQSPTLENEFVGFRIAAVAGVTPPPPPLPPPPANRAPVAVGESFVTAAGTALNVAAPGVLANDTDADADALSAVRVSGPAHGTLTLNANGSFTYTPTAGYSGADSFAYKANDGQVSGNTATVTITVSASATRYKLSVKSGTGGGSYIVGAVVTITAGTAPSGKEFDKWTGDTGLLASVTSATTTLTMPKRAATVTATYRTIPLKPLDMTRAEWRSDSKELLVSGTGPAGKKVYVTDTSSRRLGTCTVKPDSTWELRVKLDSKNVPSRVRATYSRTSDEMSVTKLGEDDDEEHD
jgi:VCBS repeat-containing protein